MECDDERRSEMGQAAKERWQGSSEQEYGFIRPSHSNDRVRYWSSTENGGLTVGHWKWEVRRGNGPWSMVSQVGKNLGRNLGRVGKWTGKGGTGGRGRGRRVRETGSLTFSVEPGGTLWEATTEHRQLFTALTARLPPLRRESTRPSPQNAAHTPSIGR